MTLQSSGTISMADINTEFGLGYNLNAYRGVTWYTDGGSSGTFSTGAIAMSDFYAKRATAAASVAISNQLAQNYSKAGIGGTAVARYQLNLNGGAYRTNLSGSLVSISGEWLTSGSASLFEAYATWSGSGGIIGGSATATWLNLSANREWTLSATNNFANRNLAVQIRLASSGAVLDTATIEFLVDSAP